MDPQRHQHQLLLNFYRSLRLDKYSTVVWKNQGIILIIFILAVNFLKIIQSVMRHGAEIEGLFSAEENTQKKYPAMRGNVPHCRICYVSLPGCPYHCSRFFLANATIAIAAEPISSTTNIVADVESDVPT